MIDLIGTLRWIKARVDQIFALVNAILTLKETGGTLNTVGVGEMDVYRVVAPMGVFKPLIVQIDFTLNGAADSITLREYYNIGGGEILKDVWVVAGVQTDPLKNINLEPNRFGVRVTLQRTAGAAKDYRWAAFFED